MSLERWRRWGATGVVAFAAGCAPAKPRVQLGGGEAPPQYGKDNKLPYKRVDHWVFSDPTQPLSAVETQLKVRFERAFPNAQFSRPLTCLAREHGAFMSKYGAIGDEVLQRELAGHCGAATIGHILMQVYPNDGTALDAPLSDELLADIVQRLPIGSGPFSAFGVTALYTGPNVLVALDTALPPVTMEVQEPDANRTVRVTGEVFADLSSVSASITQGELGAADCTVLSEPAWPKFAFGCAMAVGDHEAWVALSGTTKGGEGTRQIATLPAHTKDWSPPSEYQRKRVSLPAGVDTRRAIASVLNSFRAELKVPPVEFAAEQSEAIQAPYANFFDHDPSPHEDAPIRTVMERGERVGGEGPVSYAWTCDGVAHDGGPADWLAGRLLDSTTRQGFAGETFSHVAIATHGDPEVGFAAAAVFYELLPPTRETELADELARSLAAARRKKKTRRHPNPPEIDAAAAEIAAGAPPPEAMAAALRRANANPRKLALLDAMGLLLGDRDSDYAIPSPLPDALIEPRVLEYGVAVTHVFHRTRGWARPMAIIWFYTEAPAASKTLAMNITSASR